MPHAAKKLTVFGVLLLLLITAFYDVVFLNKTFKVTTANSQALPTGAYGQENNKPKFIPVNGTDSPVLEEPVFQFIKNNLSKGVLPLWNPHQACGYPLIGMLETGMFFPLNLVLYFLPEYFSWDILILSRFLLAAFFTYLFMRTMRFRTAPSIAAAVAFMLSGPMVLLQYWTANVDLLLPLLLTTIELLIRRPDRKSTAFLAVVMGLTVFAGHPEHIFLVNAYGFAFFICRVITSGKTKQWLVFTKPYLTAGLLGLGLAACVLLPFLYNLKFEFWIGHPDGTGLRVEEQTERALTLLMPFFFQKAPLTYQWEFSGWWGGYIGTIPFALAFLGLWNNHKKGLNVFFAAMAFLIIGKQYGLPVINFIGHLPLFDVVRYAIHAAHLAAFSVAVLAGIGVRAALARKEIILPGLLFTAAVAAITAYHLAIVKSSDAFPVAIHASLTAGILLACLLVILFLRQQRLIPRKLTAFLLVMIIFSELFLHIHRERPRRFESFPQVPYIEALKSSTERIRSYGNFWAFYPDTATGFGVDDLGYFFSLVPKRFVHFVNTMIIRDHFRNDLRPPALRAIPIMGRDDLLDLLNVKYIISPKTDKYSKSFGHFSNAAASLEEVYTNEVRIYQRPAAFPRAFITHRAIFETNEEKTMSLMNELKNGLRFVALIDDKEIPDIREKLKNTPLSDLSAVKITSYTPNKVRLDALMQNPGFIVLSDAYHPEWKVYVDGKEKKIFKTDYFLRSVFLEKGAHQIEFVFRPDSFYLGLIVSALSLILIIGMGIKNGNVSRN